MIGAVCLPAGVEASAAGRFTLAPGAAYTGRRAQEHSV